MARRWAASGVAGGCIVLALASTAHATTQAVRWSDGRLTVHAVDAARQDVLRSVAERTHTRIDGIELASGSVTLDLDGVSLRAGLQALAGDLPYALTESPPLRDGSIRYALQFGAVDGRGTIRAPPNVATMTGKSIPAPPRSDVLASPTGASFPARTSPRSAESAPSPE